MHYYPTFIDLNPKFKFPTTFILQDNPGLPCYQFRVSLGRCNGGLNTLDDPSAEILAANKTEDINSTAFNIVTIFSCGKKLFFLSRFEKIFSFEKLLEGSGWCEDKKCFV